MGDGNAGPAAPTAVPKPLLPCVIAMAGGVTSVIIHPAAVAEIAERYGFHAVAGTSVSDIAAVTFCEWRLRRPG